MSKPTDRKTPPSQARDSAQRKHLDRRAFLGHVGKAGLAGGLFAFVERLFGRSALAATPLDRLEKQFGPDVQVRSRDEFVDDILRRDTERQEADSGQNEHDTAYNRFSRAYNRFSRAYNRFSRAYNRFSRAYNRFAR